MIPFLTAQRYSREVTKNSFTSRKDKKDFKRIEKIIDKNILRACDQNKFRINFYFLLSGYNNENEKWRFYELLNTIKYKYKSQGYEFTFEYIGKNYNGHIFIKDMDYKFYISIYWDKDYTPLIEEEN